MHAYLPFDLDDIVPERETPAPEKVISGDPQFTTWLVEARDSDTLFTGVWEATPGSWRISYDEWEFCSILSGRSRLTGKDGATREVGPGDSFVLQPGFAGVWEVLETTRKLFVIRLPA
ncbi:cupin domain-containing protein [Roseibium sp. Sym1]|uniref:cupin domain-containing protein n=1 Tax=Roseibium sp. Sym1 TaxID=3016006 RepID=UPI0022B4AA57|nr:cupin domain-containing protein [Roseibium sp. Sym1]